MANFGLRILGNILKYGSGLNALRSDFQEFCIRMRIKWHFRNEPFKNFSVIPFRSKSFWKLPKRNPNFEIFLSKVEQDLFKMIETPPG